MSVPIADRQARVLFEPFPCGRIEFIDGLRPFVFHESEESNGSCQHVLDLAPLRSVVGGQQRLRPVTQAADPVRKGLVRC